MFDEITNTESESIIIEIDFFGNSNGYVGYPNFYSFSPYIYQNEYDYFSEIGKVKYNSRLKDVIGISMDTSSNWIKNNGKYYLKLESNSVANLNEVIVKILPELGGGSMDSNISSSYQISTSRQWEQSSIFNIGYVVTISEANRDDFINTFNSKLYDEISAQLNF